MAVEAFTEFPVLEKGEFYTPSHLYEIQYAKFRQPRNEVYFGVPVSSGGMRRLVQPDNLGNIRRIITLNSHLSEIFANVVAPLFPGSLLTLPPKIGKSLKPSEFNFNLYWLLHKTGVDPWFANQFAEIAQRPDILANINNHGGGIEREAAYIALSDLFFKIVRETPEINLNPITALIYFGDHRTSFGCRLEQRNVARLCEFGYDIPVFEAAINLANIGIGNPEAKLLIKAYQYIQRNGDPNINGVSFTPPFVNKPESASLIELIPLDEHKTSHKESLFEVKNGAALRIAAWRERLKAADGFGSLVADFPAETKFEVHEGIITMGNLQLEPENLAAALLEATIIDDRVTVCYPLIESGGTRLITFTISTEDKNRLLSVCL
ncbi:hypothetical protein COW80_00080 [Candidatus Beckwithbacteria bacterium CG22_combo_CG10-13_8_21_14_all_01_47_9]|uniref:Uncharacterized protein n=3 Tax=Candidatus Beckwithiibacteriota TaxID=1752726 RepID=A0A2H0E2M0_9BACT|nr:MAG: hypothetical protein AUJ59_00440 [Candidatus Beckwithbacteria bacterium CG1_02_47_37]PIP88491.1 MAG: hypothetical protein COW80_00080 [Candidatus Beckwithbacteria bacterium CG22_combo_CG10-13_8_21_14_all_01_47_9]